MTTKNTAENDKVTASMKIQYVMNIIEMLAGAPDGQLDSSLSQKCSEFVSDVATSKPVEEKDCVNFLRDIRDLVVFSGGASNVTMVLIDQVLSGYTESEEELKIRRDNLKERNLLP